VGQLLEIRETWLIKRLILASKLRQNSPTSICIFKTFSGGYIPGPPVKRGRGQGLGRNGREKGRGENRKGEEGEGKGNRKREGKGRRGWKEYGFASVTKAG
jgi:hypothetical protein